MSLRLASKCSAFFLFFWVITRGCVRGDEAHGNGSLFLKPLFGFMDRMEKMLLLPIVYKMPVCLLCVIIVIIVIIVIVVIIVIIEHWGLGFGVWGYHYRML
jgi:hypothetical protein